MDATDVKGLHAEVKKRMDAQIEFVRKELAGVRTGRASTGMLDSVQVEAYGSKMPLNQVATLSIPEPALIVAQPFDPSIMAALERAMRLSDLGLNPASDGKVLRIPIPSLTDERRKELSRHVHKMAEEGRNHVRVVRREANDKLKKMLKDHKISEDDEKRALDEVQKVTDAHIKMIDDLQAQERPGAAWEIVTSRTSSAAAGAARVPSIRANLISSARRASCRCSPATISRRRGRGRRNRWPAARRTCGAIAS